MCGIVGLISKEYNSNNFTKLLNTINHRGPDANGVEVYDLENKKVIFGHKRLSILDTSESANQPFEFHKYSVIYNGEVYNFNEIQKELILKGYSFKTQSDTEVIIKAFDCWGVKCVDKFIGMFAFAIVNKESSKITIFRDRTGIKPLYYSLDKDYFIFGSEVKIFTEYPLFKKNIDLDSLAQFFKYGYILGENSIYKKTKKLLPGHYLEFDIKNNTFEIFKYWDVNDFYEKPKLDISYTEAKEKLKILFEDAFNLRMIADVPVGVFLSGGYDSTLVTSILQKKSKTQLNTFTVGFENENFDESPAAKEIADRLNTNHHNFLLKEKEAIEIVKDLPFYFDEPFADVSSIPSIYLAKNVTNKVTVALSADGGDEIFAGYLKHKRTLAYHKKFQNFKYFSTTFNVLEKIIPSEKLRIKHNLSFLSKNVKDLSFVNLMDNISQKHNDSVIKKLLKSNYKTKKSFFDVKLNFKNKLNEMLATDYKTYLTDDILVKVDRACMASSLEGREPLIDHRIIEFAAQLPNEFKISENDQKIILKDICHDYVPKEIMDRPKKGFNLPLYDWLKGNLNNNFEEMLSDEIVLKHKVLNLKMVQKVKVEFYKNNESYYDLAWYIFVFNSWCEKWI